MGFPLIPVLIAGVALVACTQAVKNTASVDGKTAMTSLAGSEWSPSAESKQFVQFRSDTEMSGFSGCNNFGGNYELNGERLIIGPLAMTKKACMDGMEAEQEFVSALQNAHRFEATHLSLKIYDDSDEMLMELQRRDWD